MNGAIADHKVAYALLAVMPPDEIKARLNRRFPGMPNWTEPVEDFLATCECLRREELHMADQVGRKKVARAQVARSDSVERSKWMTTAQAAKRLGISQQRVRQLIEEGKLEAKQDRPGTPWRISVESVNERVASQSAG